MSHDTLVFSFYFLERLRLATKAKIMKATQKRKPPSKTKVKCRGCKQVICNRDYFRKNHFPQHHKKLAREGVDADDWWEYVEIPVKPTPKLSRNPFTVANQKCASKILTPTPSNFFRRMPDISKPKNLQLGTRIIKIKDEKISEMEMELSKLEDVDRAFDKENTEDHTNLRAHKFDEQSASKVYREVRHGKVKELRDDQALRILQLEGQLEKLRKENLKMESKRRNDETREYKIIHSLESIHGKYQGTLTELQSVTLNLKQHQVQKVAEAKVMKQATKRDWILRKEEGSDERRFCQPCLMWHQTPGAKLGNLLRSPWVNGGMSVRKMALKAQNKGKKPSYLWNEAYNDHESTQGHRRCVTLWKQQGTMNVFLRAATEDALKNRLKVAYHTTKQAESEVSYEKTILLVKEMGVNVGNTQLSRFACAEMRQTFADGMLKRQKDFFAGTDEFTGAMKLVGIGADEVTRHNRQYSIDTITALDDDHMPKCMINAVTELEGDATAPVLAAVGRKGLNRLLQRKDEDVVKTMVVGVCFDGASTYQGEYNGVGEIYRKSNPDIKKHRDRMHIEGSGLSKVLDQIKQYGKVVTLITEVRGFVGKSPKRQKSLEKLHHELHELDMVQDEVTKISESIATTRKQRRNLKRIQKEFINIMQSVREVEDEMKDAQKNNAGCRQIVTEQAEITKELAEYLTKLEPSQSITDTSITETMEKKFTEYSNRIEVLQKKNPKFESLKLRKTKHFYKILKFYKIRMVYALGLALRAIIENYKPLVAFFKKQCLRKYVGAKEGQIKQAAKAAKILASLKDWHTIVNMLSLYDVATTLSKSSKISQYPVLSILHKEVINDYFNENLNTKLFNTFGPKLRKHRAELLAGTFNNVKLCRRHKKLAFIKKRQNQAINIIKAYVNSEFQMTEYEIAAQMFVPENIRRNRFTKDEISEDFLPKLYSEQKSWMTGDIDMVRREWQKLREILLLEGFKKYKSLQINEIYAEIRKNREWRSATRNILRMVEVLQLQPIGCVQCERAASCLKRVQSDGRSCLAGKKTENEMKIIMDGAEFHELDVDFYAKIHRGKKRKYQASGEGQVITRLKSKKSKCCRW